MKQIISTLLIITLAITVADAQCRAYTKNKCLPGLSGYVQNDNYNSAMLVPGDKVELLLTFFGGKDYRLLVCNHPIIGSVDFVITDTSGEEIHKGNSMENGTFDFRMKNTQQLIVNLSVPLGNSEFVHEGCVSVMVGAKELQ